MTVKRTGLRNVAGTVVLLAALLLGVFLPASAPQESPAHSPEWTEAQWQTSQAVLAPDLSTDTVHPPANVRCTGGLFSSATIHWDAPEDGVSPQGFILEITSRNLLGERVVTHTVEDPAQREITIDRNLLNVLADLVIGTYEVHIRSIGPGNWESESSPSSTRFSVVAGGILGTNCA